MNKRLFKRTSVEAQLQELYRAADEGRDVSGIDPELQITFDADRDLIERLRLVSRGVPDNPAIGRAALLAKVAQKKSASLERERRPMIGHLLTGRGLALLAAAGIFAGGAATVGASGGVSGAAGNVSDVLDALHITDRTPDQADTHLDGIDQPDGSGADAPGGGLTNAEQHADDHAQHGLDNAAEGSDNAGQGIANASDEGLDHANSHATDGPSSGEDASAGGAPAALPTEANEHASDGGDNGAVPLPTEANEHASEGGDNGAAALPTEASEHASERGDNAPDD